MTFACNYCGRALRTKAATKLGIHVWPSLCSIARNRSEPGIQLLLGMKYKPN